MRTLLIAVRGFIFTQYKEEGVNKLKRLLDRFGVEVITGDSSERQRLRAVETFQADPTRRIFLATPKDCGRRVDLDCGKLCHPLRSVVESCCCMASGRSGTSQRPNRAGQRL